MSFQHTQSAHCESGVMSAMISHHGTAMSEPMAFGLGSALAFAYIPIVKLAGQPLIAYRMPPKSIIKSLSKRLGIKMRFQKFSDPITGANALDDALNQNKLVGLQTSVFWLPYFPPEMRFHFNAHNMLVYGKEEKEYLVSDPVFEEVVRVEGKHLNKARFAKGALAPKGLMYTLEEMPQSINYDQAIPSAIRKNFNSMTKAPLPVIGIRGIRYLSKKVRHLSKKLDRDQQRLYLGHIVRMQEEIGTGGAGFRFIYASFLEESGKLLNDDTLIEASNAMTETGDLWREFAVRAVQQGKGTDRINLPILADKLLECANEESKVWAQLNSWCKTQKK